MEWMEEVQKRIKHGNQILFSKESAFLQDIDALIAAQDRRTVTLWALSLAEEAADILAERYPQECSARSAVDITRLWASGTVKMPEAKREILRCHAFAKKITALEDIALCHAVGQACSVVHTKRHAMGFPVYELTAIVRHYGLADCKEPVLWRKQEYMDRMLYWQSHAQLQSCIWADFMWKE